MTLSAKHHDMLHRASAISDTVIQTRRYCSLDHPDEVRDLGFSKAQSRTAPVLAIPLWDVHGDQCGWQIRPDSPRQMRDGKVFKYETVKGGRVQLDVHPSVQPLLGNPSIPLWITEGVRKGDALVSAGACAIALTGGVWGFRGTNEHGGKVILPDWEHIALNGRRVVVAFDSDIATKPNVKAALAALWRFLRDRQALPVRVHWPDEYQQRKWGADDYLASGKSLDDLLALIPPMGPLPPTAPHQRNGSSPPPRDDIAILPWSDYANALAFVRDHGENLRYCFPWGKWLVWSGTHWEIDTTGQVMRLAKETVKRLARHAEDLDDLSAIGALLRHVKASMSTPKLRALVENAQSELPLPILPEALDRDPWLLNCRNGTLNLTTGTIQPHCREDLLTRCIPVAYDPQALCPIWDMVLWRIMGGTTSTQDSENDSALLLEARQAADERAKRLMAYLQRAIGYTLTGQTSEQCLFLLHGTGSNGKSTFVEVLQMLLEAYAKSTPSASLLAKDRHDGIPNDIARLRGARLVTAIEIGEGRRLNEELVKRLTGQDTMTARFLFAEFFDFKPEFKLFIACNHLPTIKGTDHAIWRRIQRIPFVVTIPEDEQDKELPQKLKAELPGILAWAVRGCRAWVREGLAPPDEVIDATKDYRASMDVIGQFIDECCVVGHSYREKALDLFEGYKRWCDASGETSGTLAAFGSSLQDRGYLRHKAGTVWRLGIALNNN